MRRLVLLGLLGLGVNGCAVEPTDGPEQQEKPLCPELVISDLSRSPGQQLPVSTASSALRPASTAAQPVLVRFRSKAGMRSATALRQREDKLRQAGGRLKYHWPSLDAAALSLTPEAQARLAQDPDVLSITPDRPVHALGLPPSVPAALAAVPETPAAPSESTWAVRMTGANEVWDADGDGVFDSGAVTGSGITVCVIDSGIDRNHPELKVTYAGGKDFIDDDDNPEDKDASGAWGGGHGTHVAGTIVAQLGSGGQVDPNDATLSSNGMVGMAPGARLLVARVLDERGDGRTSDVIAALEWCGEMKANIVSLSLGSSTPDETEEKIFQELWDANILAVAASGNSGDLSPYTPMYPAAYSTVIAVGAVKPDMKHASYSQGGEHLSLVAPGTGVYSTYPRGNSPFANLVADGTFYKSRSLDYVPFEEYEGTLVDCGLGASMRSCLGASVACSGFVAYVDRGDIRFNEKVKNVRSQGARAVIIGNNDPADDDELGFTLGNSAEWPPVTAVTTTTAQLLRGQFGKTVRVGIRGGDYAYSTGTSMATPHVAGVAALVWSANPNLKNSDVRRILESTAKDLVDAEGSPDSAVGKDPVFGYGLVQALPAVEQALREAQNP
ncbi:MAG TPA: S8 family serine peptidase [Archangium sp.]|uniref:S8 family serine peptidase n=1 Tax=Archangium sp. TaxID=1872627 RepID=UPI002E2FAFF4|nr:S8 family serine peptidase [Archangium sp.]HEX5752218.1 S8 family serine peptidase [Archangium sp.]